MVYIYIYIYTHTHTHTHIYTSPRSQDTLTRKTSFKLTLIIEWTENFMLEFY